MLVSNRGEGTVDFIRGTGIEHFKLELDRLGGRLCIGNLGSGVRTDPIDEHGDDGCLGREVAQEPKSLARNIGHLERETRDVAARPAHGRDKTSPDRIEADHKHDRNGCSRSFRRDRGGGRLSENER